MKVTEETIQAEVARLPAHARPHVISYVAAGSLILPTRAIPLCTNPNRQDIKHSGYVFDVLPLQELLPSSGFAPSPPPPPMNALHTDVNAAD
eukprot:6745025-Pyramimonas_sp.AAC.1